MRLLISGVGRLFTSGSGGTIDGAAVVVESGRLAWVGAEADLPDRLRGACESTVDAEGRLMTAGLIDAHTHPLYAGDRAREVAMRARGASYADVAAAGGGIASTVSATRAASAATLAELAADRLRAWPRGGATTVEAKTGYHLERHGEIEAVRVLAGLSASTGLPRLEVTFLGAHAVPVEFAGRRAEYASEVAAWCPDAAAGGARFCDVFCDQGYFSVDEAREILEAGSRAGLIPRMHADELARTGGALLAAELGAASADHLLRIESRDMSALAAAGVVATLCPGTALSMGTAPPARGLVEHGVTLALGTDHNPGTSGLTSMSLVVALAVAVFGLSVEEALIAATAGGAASLRLADRGVIETGRLADLVLWDAHHEGAFAWGFGLPAHRVWMGGVEVVPA